MTLQSRGQAIEVNRPYLQAEPAADWAATVQEAAWDSAELARAAMDYLALVISIE